MGQAKRRGTKEARVLEAITREAEHRRKARRFVHLCRFINPYMTRAAIVKYANNRGFSLVDADGLPPRMASVPGGLSGYSLLSGFAGGYSMPKKGFR